MNSNNYKYIKSLQEKIRNQSGWSFRDPPDLPTDFKYEILTHLDGSYAFRIFQRKNPEYYSEYTEFWLHSSAELPNVWYIYPRSKWAKQNYEWHKADRYELLWDEKRQLFTKGVSKLPGSILETVEMFNLLVKASLQGFETKQSARILWGDSPFEESKL